LDGRLICKLQPLDSGQFVDIGLVVVPRFPGNGIPEGYAQGRGSYLFWSKFFRREMVY
jgi:hypothetical protein